MQKPLLDPRAAAAQTLARILQQRESLNTALPNTLTHLAGRDHALAQELVYGTLRWLPQLEFIAKQLLQKPLKPADVDLYALILCGLYQLRHTRIPDHAAISASVATCAVLGKGWARGLLNAVLRNAQRQQEDIDTRVQANLVAHFAHPQWLLERLKSDWPDDWQNILNANNQRPPMHLRVNARKTNRDDYLAQLAAADIPASAHPHARYGITLEKPTDVAKLPGFADGLVSVQDPAAQLASELLDVQADDRVLDACAAPGGKTAAILEAQPQLQNLIALDNDATRLTRVDDNLQRLQLKAQCLTADAGEVSSWWDGVPFQRILLDAPCSASGVIRRHPDIKHLRRPTDLAKLANTQSQLLAALWPTLAPGGTLLYATCSTFTRENDAVIRAFCETTPDATNPPIAANWGKISTFGRQILPGEAGMDGFYYACLKKSVS